MIFVYQYIKDVIDYITFMQYVSLKGPKYLPSRKAFDINSAKTLKMKN